MGSCELIEEEAKDIMCARSHSGIRLYSVIGEVDDDSTEEDDNKK